MENINLDLYKSNIINLRKYTKDMSVLFAEDYEPLHETLKKLFTSLFKEVDSAYDGVEALKLYDKKVSKNERYSIVFSDIEMPNMNGIELVQEIKKRDKTSEIAVFSAHQDSKYLLELINLGVRRFILKPASLAKILDELILICDDIYFDKNITQLLTLTHNIVYNKETKTLLLNDTPIDFTKYEHHIIQLLMQRVNLAVSNDDIVHYLYENMIDMNVDNVRKLMYKLRRKLPKDFIQSIHGIGYRVITFKESDN